MQAQPQGQGAPLQGMPSCWTGPLGIQLVEWIELARPLRRSPGPFFKHTRGDKLRATSRHPRQASPPDCHRVPARRLTIGVTGVATEDALGGECRPCRGAKGETRAADSPSRRRRGPSASTSLSTLHLATPSGPYPGSSAIVRCIHGCALIAHALVVRWMEPSA